MTPFTTHHLRFTVEVETPIELSPFKGSALRGAWQSHLRTLYCAQAETADPLHQTMCPVCYLLSRDTGSGDDRRPYAFIPPLTTQTRFERGERFQFGISLFGRTGQFVPYLVLAVGQMGRHQGLGKQIHPGAGEAAPGRKRPVPRKRRGTFRLVEIEEVNLVTRQQRTLLAEGETMVQMPAIPIDDAAVAARSRQIVATLAEREPHLALTFLTPTRIIQAKRLVHQPHFSPFFTRLVDRLDALRQQYAGQPRLSRAERDHLLDLANRVTLVSDRTTWWDLVGHSARLQRPQRLGGFAGQATYQAGETETWAALLPWLIWGTAIQVGKHVVKGCGWYELDPGD